ncbi:MAG: hypothetical protein JWR01_2897 [Subtercola sp.]|nr:hypothetical protein [Subtercola sp.]
MGLLLPLLEWLRSSAAGLAMTDSAKPSNTTAIGHRHRHRRHLCYVHGVDLLLLLHVPVSVPGQTRCVSWCLQGHSRTQTYLL